MIKNIPDLFGLMSSRFDRGVEAPEASHQHRQRSFSSKARAFGRLRAAA
jgi:hypothetical protein